MYHQDFIAAGRKMAEKVRLFADHGYSSDLQPAFMASVFNTMKDYMNLMSPPKLRWCPCLKPARTGILYQALFLMILASMFSVTFECEAVVIEYCCQRSLLESLHFVDYTHRMINIQNEIREISKRSTEQLRESVRIELLRAIETVERYLLLFNTDTAELMSKSYTKLESFAELLAAPAEWNIARYTQTKVIASLQVIMNEVSEISLKRSNDSIATLNTLAAELGTAWNAEVIALSTLEAQFFYPSLRQYLQNIIRGNEERHNNSHLTILEAKRRWTTTKFQSVPRPIIASKELEFDDNKDDFGTANRSQNLKIARNSLISPFTVEKTTYTKCEKNNLIDRSNHAHNNGNTTANDMIKFYPTILDSTKELKIEGNLKKNAAFIVTEDDNEGNKKYDHSVNNEGNIPLNYHFNSDKKGNNYHVIEDNS